MSERSAKTWKRTGLTVATIGIGGIFISRRGRHYGNHWTYWYDRISLALKVEKSMTHSELSRAMGAVPACSSDGDQRICR